MSLVVANTLFIKVSGITDPVDANGIYYRRSYDDTDAEYRHAINGLYDVEYSDGNYAWRLHSSDTFFTHASEDPDSIPVGSWAESAGTGTVAIAAYTPTLEIAKPDDLQMIVYNTDSLAADYVQVNDIDMDVAPYNAGDGFTPIGTNADPFTGTYNGQNKTISKLRINRDLAAVGLFGQAGTLAALNEGIRNVIIQDATITNSSTSASVRTGGAVGHLFGCLTNVHVIDSTIQATGVTTNIQQCGGVVGFLQSGQSERCSGRGLTVTHASTNASSSTGLIAGQVGSNSDETIGIVKKSWVEGGSVDGHNAGGFVGVSFAAVYEDCFTTGAVNGRNRSSGFSNSAGGARDEFKRCYAANSPACDAASIAAFAHQIVANFTVTDCYFDSTLAGEVTDANATGQNTAAMKDEANYANWNFRTTWNIDKSETLNDGYPYLDRRSADDGGMLGGRRILGGAILADRISGGRGVLR